MFKESLTELQSGLSTAFIDSANHSNLAYRPQFIYNNNKNGQKVFSAIEDELLGCDRFAISVAFITRGGITPLLQTLQELERRGVPGRILTTDYLSFTDPVALDTIAGFLILNYACIKQNVQEMVFTPRGISSKKVKNIGLSLVALI